MKEKNFQPAYSRNASVTSPAEKCSCGLLVSCMLDIGASQTIVSTDVARDAKLIVRPTMTELCNASNTVMHLLGESEVVLCKNKHSVTSTVLVASNLNNLALISWQDLQQLHVIPKSFLGVAAVACTFNELKTKTIAAFSSVFSDT